MPKRPPVSPTRRSAGSIRRKHDGWEVRLRIGTDPRTGMPRRVSRFVRGTQADAEQVLLELRYQHLEGRLATVDATVAELIAAWLEVAGPRLSPTTLQGYRSKITTHLLPALGDIPLRKLSSPHLDRLYARLERQHLAPATIRQVHAIIRRALVQGRRWGWIDRNPAELASPPPVHHQEVQPPNPSVVAAVIARCRDDNPDFADFLHMALVTGARRGEMCGLQWADLEGDVITIRRSIAETAAGIIVKDTKSYAARRVILDPGTVARLRERQVRCLERATMAGSSLGPWIFGADIAHAQPWPPDSATGAWRRLAARSGLDGVRLHDLRHASATTLIDAGVPVTTVARRLGHRDSTTTLRIYAHAVEDADRRAAEIIGGASQHHGE